MWTLSYRNARRRSILIIAPPERIRSDYLGRDDWAGTVRVDYIVKCAALTIRGYPRHQVIVAGRGNIDRIFQPLARASIADGRAARSNTVWHDIHVYIGAIEAPGIARIVVMIGHPFTAVIKIFCLRDAGNIVCSIEGGLRCGCGSRRRCRPAITRSSGMNTRACGRVAGICSARTVVITAITSQRLIPVVGVSHVLFAGARRREIFKREAIEHIVLHGDDLPLRIGL